MTTSPPASPTVLAFLCAATLLAGARSRAFCAETSPVPPLRLEILSSKTLNGIAGDYVTVKAQITNTGQKPVGEIITYLSLVDTESKLPVDLEDWSAEKGLYIGMIDPGQTLPLEWQVHFVKAGTYSLIIVAEIAGAQTPEVSSITRFNVAPKHNLNPGQVLPVALGVPILVIAVLFMLNYRRRTKD
jgi:hypothetical protein